MSSMRNAVQRRQHRERGQIQGREKWGILEKHKDYSLRARDYNAKKAKLKRLEEKVRDRNPDEFAFGMMSSGSSKAGKHGASNRASAAGLSHDAVKLLKTQDAGYLRTVGERVRRQMEKLEQEVRLQDGLQEIFGEKGKDAEREEEDDDDEFGFDFGDEEDTRKPRKMVFADDQMEQRSLQSRKLRDEEDDDDDEDDEEDDSFGQLQKRQQKKSRKELEAERQALVEARRMRKTKKRAAEARQNKLNALQKQYADITAASNELDWQRARMDNSVGGTNKDGIKWKIRERKR
ncbi:putative U3 small nucleolar RNA-associated protein Utp11 [Aspergillus steynii IBT 23096]|uniref:Putative U3 small nucleolar RNA-associated protein Utp11 n=1 Tax=Aspergillus steynii IBT 23096 TaxID=1392250 RepID=A0A2I2G604_9EURO|nr:putative U3 small nucleolar RNA-associated protein Utp11 [Aspergillus steynii IBT 23096]PLB48299.1 putative U3 small nucleolar RNA-associated protein Utp11 [Aspergillus steynii IBT 23096]